MEAMAIGEVDAGRANSGSDGDEIAPAYFNNEDAWSFLDRYRSTQDLYSEECKKTHRLEERLVDLEAVLQGTEESLVTVKRQLVQSNLVVVGNHLSLLISCIQVS